MTQPTSIPVSEEILAAEEAARNNVDLLVAESQRYEKLIASQKRDLVSLDGALADIKDQIDVITTKRITLAQEVIDIENNKASLTSDINNLTVLIEATKAEMAVREDELSGRESDIVSTEHMLREAEIAITERSNTLAVAEEVIRNKKEILAQALLSL